MMPTTFVIGAGTSMPFGMPSGLGLLKKICSSECDFDYRRYEFFTSGVWSHTQEYDIDLHNDFRERLRTCNLNSVDRFVQGKSQFDLYAKACISHVLLQEERRAAFHCTDVLYDKTDQNAFRRLWNAFADSSDIVKELQRHRFVTFNYDRLLEHFIFTSLIQGELHSVEEALAIVRKLDIVHVYGSLGEYQVDSINSYGCKIEGGFNTSNRDFNESVKSLNLLTTHRASNENSERVAQHFFDTKQVVVLGFGFDVTNCEYLRSCWIQAYGGVEEHANLKMKQRWKVCMYQKQGACENRARHYFRVGADEKVRLSIGKHTDHDAAFLEHNVL